MLKIIPQQILFDIGSGKKRRKLLNVRKRQSFSMKRLL